MPAQTKRFRYTGGPQQISVVLPERSVMVTAGDTITVSPGEAKRLADHPDFTPVKPGRAQTSSNEED